MLFRSNTLIVPTFATGCPFGGLAIGVDILVNNAGTMYSGRFARLKDDELKNQLETKLFGFMRAIRERDDVSVLRTRELHYRRLAQPRRRTAERPVVRKRARSERSFGRLKVNRSSGILAGKR